MASNHRLSCLLMGDQSLLTQCAEMLRDRGHSLAGIVTGDAAIRRWAEGVGVRVLPPGRDLHERLAGSRFDWFFGIANLRIVPEAVWSMAAQGAANFHDGPLPRYAGLNAPAWAILRGEMSHGVTWHALTRGIDEGDIYVQRDLAIDVDETAFTLNAKCYEAAIDTFGELLGAIEGGTLSGRPQDMAARSYFAKHDRPPAGATLRFDRPAAELDALVRALDYGAGYANPLLLPKLETEAGLFAVTRLTLQDAAAPSAPPGTVLALDSEGAVISTADRPVKLERIVRLSGAELPAASVLAVGARLPLLSESAAARRTELVGEAVRQEEHFAGRLARLEPLELPELLAAADGARPRWLCVPLRLPAHFQGDAAVAAIAAYLLRATGQARFDVAYADDALAATAKEAVGHLAASVPLRVEGGEEETFATLAARVAGELSELRRRRTYPADLAARRPGLQSTSLAAGLRIAATPAADHAIPGCAATFVLPAQGLDGVLVYDQTRLPAHAAEALVRRMALAFAALAQDPGVRIGDIGLLSQDEERRLLHEWNRSDVAYDRSACLHSLFERQVDATPDAPALAFAGELISYAQLEGRANRIANALRRLGVTPDAPVGLYLRRSLELVAAAIGIQKAGGAYVPLDPSYPADRLAFMIQDSGARVIVTERALAPALPAKAAHVLCIDDAALAGESDARPAASAAAHNLAYVIYTSGSTGQPKGVMVEHRNVVNFFAGMDARVPRPTDVQPVWLAVTSLSFDISILELFWTLCRGFKVVISADEDRALASAGAAAHAASRPMDFGLFYWGNDDAAGSRKYRLLLEGAKFADARGFHSLWTPERHFHAFGGPYPNPAVTGAAVAAVTRNLQIRAGSCVLPLHHPARVAEEWAVVDNLSDGRVGVSFASGWMPEDFLLRPENAPPHNNSSMIRDIDVVRRLWRGERVAFESPNGEKTLVLTQPRPVQKELPVWVTTAGNPETYRKAAALGANVLTHLLGQSIGELAAKIRLYREALIEHGRNPADFRVTLMVHTLVGEDRKRVEELARQPMKDYLRSAAALIKQYAWAFPAFKRPPGVDKPMDIDLQALPAEDMEAILEFAFLRYFNDSGLFGTVEDAVARVEELKAIGVDEVACLVDFGVPTETALAGLEPLAEVLRRTSRPALHADAQDYSIAAQLHRHGVTHLQCTPSMARMLAMNDETRFALSRVRHLFIGGEALPGALVAELRRINPAASVENMYGPTETTIWSATQSAEPCAGVVPLGRPIANTQLYVLDGRQRPVPPGTAGELCIAGDGVARGYLHREELTRERFVRNPFRAEGRMYRTGDMARYTEEGVLQFLGRMDHQVKVRGYRIELGEIEARLSSHPSVHEAVVLAREDSPGDVRLVAYIRWAGAAADDETLRAYLRAALPEYMVPAHFVAMDRFPLTPNAKVNRKALPPPEHARPGAAAAEYRPPENDLQRQIAEIYKKILRVPQVGLGDNFFQLGGHSLLAVQAHRELRAAVAPALTITDIFRFPTVGGLAAHLGNGAQVDAKLDRVADRAVARREAMAQRREARKARVEK